MVTIPHYGKNIGFDPLILTTFMQWKHQEQRALCRFALQVIFPHSAQLVTTISETWCHDVPIVTPGRTSVVVWELYRWGILLGSNNIICPKVLTAMLHQKTTKMALDQEKLSRKIRAHVFADGGKDKWRHTADRYRPVPKFPTKSNYQKGPKDPK